MKRRVCSLKFFGPFPIDGEEASVRELPDSSGVYLWCIKRPAGDYLVHYVGETQNIKKRTIKHYRQQMKGAHHAFCPDSLQENILVLMHRAGFGLISRYEVADANEVNLRYVNSLRLFYALLPQEWSRSERCQYETALAYLVEDHGQNILYVSRLNKLKKRTVSVIIDTTPHNIVGLTGQTFSV